MLPEPTRSRHSTGVEGSAPKETGPARPESAAPPSISLPKGGGALRGIGEKFAANPVTGTASMTVPIATSPGRAGFGPHSTLTYDSGAGNGPFGLGWNLSLPSITRKTDKGLPQYADRDGSDVFLLSGAEDLVPVLVQVGNSGSRKSSTRTVGGKTYRVQRYRPRVEGLFARIERWANQADPADAFWRSISKDNITTWYGRTAESRIADPADATRIFSWLICESYDDLGNAVAYRYKAENGDRVDLAAAHEQNRGRGRRRGRTANRYLKRIRYGNHTPHLPKLLEDKPWPQLPGDDQWYFEVVFDYGEHNGGHTGRDGAVDGGGCLLVVPGHLRGADRAAVPACADVPPHPRRPRAWHPKGLRRAGAVHRVHLRVRAGPADAACPFTRS